VSSLKPAYKETCLLYSSAAYTITLSARFVMAYNLKIMDNSEICIYLSLHSLIMKIW